jgi:hypothetical protein
VASKMRTHKNWEEKSKVVHTNNIILKSPSPPKKNNNNNNNNTTVKFSLSWLSQEKINGEGASSSSSALVCKKKKLSMEGRNLVLDH